MLLGAFIMENGTVSYDIFSSSNMNYEDTYKAVSSWTNVKKLVFYCILILNEMNFFQYKIMIQ